MPWRWLIAFSLVVGVVQAEDLPEEEAPAVKPLIPPPHPRPSSAEEQLTIPSSVVELARTVAGDSLGHRMDVVTRPFLGHLYINDAAGEGRGVDLDPPSRYDIFDCLTFVEETLALAMAPDPLDAPLIRDALRYRGTADYANRRHFMEAEWVPDAVKNGFLQDITTQLGEAHWSHKQMDLPGWQNWGKRRSVFFNLPDASLPVGDWSLPYLDLDQSAAALERVPAGTIVLTVRVDRPGVPTSVSHVGFVVRDPGGQPRMRHASRMGKQVVREDFLSWYVQHLREYDRRPVAGLSFLLPREMGPRVSALPPGSTRPLAVQQAPSVPPPG